MQNPFFGVFCRKDYAAYANTPCKSKKKYVIKNITLHIRQAA